MSADPIHNRIVALRSAQPQLTHAQIAEMVGRSSRTVDRVLDTNSDLVEQLERTFLDELQTHLNTLQTSEDTALNYVELATSAKNEAVRLGAQDRILDIRGVITDKERLRAKQHDAPTSQPMFVLPPGAHVAVTINTTTSSNKDTVSDRDNKVIDVTATKQTTGSTT